MIYSQTYAVLSKYNFKTLAITRCLMMSGVTDTESGDTIAQKVLRSWKTHTINQKFEYFDDEKEKSWKEPFFFIQGADIQFGLIQRYIEKNPEPGWSKEIKLAELAVEKINGLNPKPKFFVICGDLCDAFPAQDRDLRQEQELTFKRIFQKLDPEIPLVCVCGNHDVGDQPTEESVRIYRSSFGDDYFSFWYGGVLFLTINSQYFYDGSQVPQLAKQHEIWLTKQLEESKDTHKNRIVVFQHIPWFVSSANEETENPYFTIKPEVRVEWLRKFKDAGVQAVFCGHLHRNAGGSFEDIDVVVTSAMGGQLGTDQPGLRIVQVAENAISHTYYSLENFPSTVNLSN